MTDPFKLLGLKRATATEAEVKAAYAALLKTTRPEDDRDAFLALRAAFTNARAVAKGNDARKAAQPAPAAQPVPEAKTEQAPEKPAPKRAKPVKWSYKKKIDWRVPDNAYGQLLKDTLEWMVAGGKDGAAFVQQVSERLMTDDDIHEAAFRAELVDYILMKADTEHEADQKQSWEMFEVTAPSWLNETLMDHLANGLRIFRDKPTDSYGARNYNVVLNLFEPVLKRSELADDPFDDIDIKTLFANEQNEYGQDDYGSHFDRDEMVWKDMSPVGVAMRDIDAAIKRGLWDLPVQIKAILNRDDVQSIEEHQDLDIRLRAKICDATGQHNDGGKLVYPPWLTTGLLLLLDDTFGWSRHHGRHQWERQQFTWLHKVIARDRKIKSDVPTFRAAPHTPARAQAAGQSGLWALLYANPLALLAGYFGYRLLQIVIRIAT